MSAITYNGVTLPYAFVTDFKQEVLYDEMGQTDWFLTKFDIVVEAILHADYLTLLFPSLVGKTDNSAVIQDAIRSKLLKPRQAFKVTFNGVNLLPGQTASLGTTNVDAQNGPKPQYCNLAQLTNTSYLLSWRVIAHYWENNNVNPNLAQDLIVQNRIGNNVLYNRWSETVEIDYKNAATRTREGKFAIRSDNNDGKIADEVRSQMAIVSVPAGFLRDRSQYTVTPDGLALAYAIVDKEVFKKPPSPAFRATGHYHETTSQFAGFNRIGEVRVALEGSKTTSQKELVNTAIRIAMSKLFIRGHQVVQGGFARNKFNILEHGGVKIGLYDNTVEVVFRMIQQLDGRRKNAIAAFQDMDTFTPGSDRTYQPPYLNRGTSNFLLNAAAYYDPSIATTRIAAGPNATNENPLTPRGAEANQLSRGVEIGRAGNVGE